ncbi:MAG TPA: energy-coupling factor ABC transporter substrate-binding protein [Methanomassiliicoccales archaeon]|jgi:cobalt/nickel transport protein|nr:energy-coupling factor ABC transporter substrate-binding protein [Methanomassiliicoccales archaeon]MCE5261639.1 energy-coupling factor ABC transporter substrate-binding protein [Euryarchaeota archaeon]HOE52139.1 energy-coupling factor ABC transporter substrate-binding protein [Methanomassiliicoccales archaeon]HOO04636.1 energy-coupling factor ABC transporter substrate-binding protein [Methanomassiliicoccales archaeon]HQM67404.1 energy-coupling factor ABC transporter substrate-binding protein
MRRSHYYLLGLLAVAVLLVSAVILNPSSDFTGTDDSGSDVINDVDPDYEPWFESIWEPSGELQTLLFTLQAAIGALIIGYFIGTNRAHKERGDG